MLMIDAGSLSFHALENREDGRGGELGGKV